MNKNKKIVWEIIGIAVLAIAFFMGVSYGKNQTPAANNGQFAQNGGARMRNFGGAGGFTAGKIIAKDATSITVQLLNGGSKIVFFDANTKILKQTNGTLTDLTMGTEVTVTGTSNTDGSENAQTLQIRPNLPSGAKVQ